MSRRKTEEGIKSSGLWSKLKNLVHGNKFKINAFPWEKAVMKITSGFLSPPFLPVLETERTKYRQREIWTLVKKKIK